MKKLFIIIILLFLISGCGRNTDLDKEFEKKKECAEYREAIQEKLEMDYPNTSTMAFRLEEVFYSPRLNTCLYAYQLSYPNHIYSQNIIDYFTNETVWLESNDNNSNIQSLFNKELEYLKN